MEKYSACRSGSGRNLHNAISQAASVVFLLQNKHIKTPRVDGVDYDVKVCVNGG